MKTTDFWVLVGLLNVVFCVVEFVTSQYVMALINFVGACFVFSDMFDNEP